MHELINRLQAIYGTLEWLYIDNDTVQFKLNGSTFEAYDSGNVAQILNQHLVEYSQAAIDIEKKIGYENRFVCPSTILEGDE